MEQINATQNKSFADKEIGHVAILKYDKRGK